MRTADRSDPGEGRRIYWNHEVWDQRFVRCDRLILGGLDDGTTDTMGVL